MHRSTISHRHAAIMALLALVAACTLLGDARLSSAADKPNIIVILADDIGAGELACYGNTEHKTPNLDRLAATGVKFETGFTCPVCHPTRFMLMTGQYGCHNGIYNFGSKRGGPEPNDPAEDITTHVTFAQLLKAEGYATALGGKWQLSGRQPNLIYEAGFDEYCSWGYGQYYTDEDREKATAAGIDFRARYWHPSVIRNARWIPTGPDDYGPDLYNDFVIDFMHRHAYGPFFLYYPMCLTHGPWLSTPDSTRSAADREKNSKEHYPANVEYMDKLVGRLVAVLDELGIRENTVVFFAGDNGTGGNGKSQATELGARVPMIVNGPGLVKPRGSTLELTDLSDVLPTVVELAGAKLPTDRPIDGHSYAGFLRGETESTRDWIFAFQADRRILRTKRWLLEDNSPLHWGRLYDCGDRRDGHGYRDATDSNEPEVLAAKAHFDKLIEGLDAPYIDHEGAPNETKAPRNRGARRNATDAD